MEIPLGGRRNVVCLAGQKIPQDCIQRIFPITVEIVFFRSLFFDRIPHRGHCRDQFVFIDGFREVKIHSVPDRGLGVGKVGVAAQDDKVAVKSLFPGYLNDLDP